MGAGVQGLAEAPWLELDTPAATAGWWARSAPLPPAGVHDTGTWRVSQPGTDPAGPGSSGTSGRRAYGAAAPAVTEQGTGARDAPAPWRDGDGQAQAERFGGFANGQGGSGREDSHTLVVDRRDGGRNRGGREPFLGRWLFSPRLLIVAVIIGLGVVLGLSGWWLTSGRFVQVPSVSGDSAGQATVVLTADGFTVKRGGRAPSNSVDKGMVVGTSPAGRVPKGSTIAILVSSGPFTSVVPAVKGDTQAAAQAALQRGHLISAIAKVGSDAPVGTVVGTNPPAGTTWPQTKPVTILVASGPPLPDFVGTNVQTAQQWASQHNVNLRQQPDSDSQQLQGTITGQHPAAGATVQPGRIVIVRVSTGPALVNVPNPIGMSVEQATQVLQAAGFVVQVNQYGPFDKVFDYNPVGQAPRGSTVTLATGF